MGRNVVSSLVVRASFATLHGAQKQGDAVPTMLTLSALLSTPPFARGSVRASMEDFQRHVVKTILKNFEDLDLLTYGQIKYKCEVTRELLKRLLREDEEYAHRKEATRRR